MKPVDLVPFRDAASKLEMSELHLLARLSGLNMTVALPLFEAFETIAVAFSPMGDERPLEADYRKMPFYSRFDYATPVPVESGSRRRIHVPWLFCETDLCGAILARHERWRYQNSAVRVVEYENEQVAYFLSSDFWVEITPTSTERLFLDAADVESLKAGEAPKPAPRKPDHEQVTFWHESDYLSYLNTASAMFWGKASPGDKTTHPKESEIVEWLTTRESAMTPSLAKKAATIIRPKWAADGRPPSK